VRAARDDDVAAIRALLLACTPADLRARYFVPHAPAAHGDIRTALFGRGALGARVATDDATVAGIGELARGDAPEIGLLVAAPCRRRGYGGALLDALIRDAAAAGAPVIDGYALWENVAVAALLRSRGFSARYDGGGVVRWRKALVQRVRVP